MARTIMLIPVSSGVGLTSVSLGMVRAMERHGVAVNFFKPVSQPRQRGSKVERSTALLRSATNIEPPEPLPIQHAEQLISAGNTDDLLEEMLDRYQPTQEDTDVVVVEGLIPSDKYQFAHYLNQRIAKMLDAEIVLVAHPGSDNSQQLKDHLELALAAYGGRQNPRVAGAIINKVGEPADLPESPGAELTDIFEPDQPHHSNLEVLRLFSKSPLPILGCIPWHPELIAPRARDLANHFHAEVINEGEIEERRLHSITFCARSIPHMLHRFRPGAMLVASADRVDVMVAACLAAMNGIKIGCLMLTGGLRPQGEVLQLCAPAMKTGLPIILVKSNSWQTALRMQSFNLATPADDIDRIERVQDYVAGYIDKHWIESLTKGSSLPRRLSPPAFRYMLTELARKANKRIVLPEGDEPRTVRAATICAERGIARPILLGDPASIQAVAEQQGLTLGEGVEIIDPAEVIERYVAPMVELRKGKGLTEVVAREQLKDNVVLGTMMLAEDEVDGLVSGAVHTTANTIRPALQLIKTAPGASLVSSVFFMLLPEQVLVYGDCAINPDPNAEQLADIAIQSADSAKAFGIEPKVAMISYSTGSSGSGSDVEKVREATAIAKEKRPDLAIDGPLQYDAAVMENVARKKAPDSPVAGKATVFIFPDLNTGNTTYKAVQRSADLISIGPMLQGMRKPVNDLSRGALVDDIVYTIALTAIQATQGN
ncbi:phosphate acetyltransferase [Biformimicrobium ophioploci]|uniref:Phosphate acetyltransferase n=1 Tax=Biformimicrobium ophioploci TaxID=3036711 RepID=A0ABQ6M017_9GAMM|nr:phosphate acetyltransferase [Microbulbifer sp. NKW57]GMG87646.1 phosphate acetyltransferase [Microbulbifer sp. NKW57]